MKHRNAASATNQLEPSQLAYDELRALLFERMTRIRGALQRWHTALMRTPGGAAMDTFRGQGRALALLAQEGEMTQRDMCAALGIRPQSLGETLAKLERAGHITRRPSETDHRALCVRITESGRALVERSEPTLPFATFSTDELLQFISYIDRALADIDEQVAELERRTRSEDPVDDSLDPDEADAEKPRAHPEPESPTA